MKPLPPVLLGVASLNLCVAMTVRFVGGHSPPVFAWWCVATVVLQMVVIGWQMFSPRKA